MTEEPGYSMIHSLHRLYRGAWIIVLAMLIGAGVGWALSRSMPAVYEASASITTTIDYSRTGILTDLEEDQSIVAVGDLIRSTSVKEQVSQQADALGMDLQDGDLGRMLSLDRVGFRWSLRARAEQPRLAHDLVNLWANLAIDRLNEALAHAETAAYLEQQMAVLIDCLEQSPNANPAGPLCADLSRSDVQNQLSEIGDQLQAERQAAAGFYPAVLVSLDQPQDLPTKPVLYAHGEMIFAGAVLGFIVALLLLESNVGIWLKKKVVRDR